MVSSKSVQTNRDLVLKTWLFTLLSAVLCFFLHMGMSMLLTSFATEVIGDRVTETLTDGTIRRTEAVYETNEAGEKVLMKRVYILDPDDGSQTLVEESVVDTDKLDAESTATGAETNTTMAPESTTNTVVSAIKEHIRTEMAPGTKIAFDIIIQILMATLFIVFPYSHLWDQGDRDHNSVQFGHMAEDKWRGLKIGLLASIPAFAAFLLLIVFKAAQLVPQYVVYYRWINVCFWSIFNFFIPTSVLELSAVSWAAVPAMLIILAVLPLMTHIGYTLGYRQISIRDKIVYKTTGRHLKHRRKRR